jgi:hypothetical protein
MFNCCLDSAGWLRAECLTGQCSIRGRGENFLLSTSSRTVFGPAQPPIQWVPELQAFHSCEASPAQDLNPSGSRAMFCCFPQWVSNLSVGSQKPHCQIWCQIQRAKTQHYNTLRGLSLKWILTKRQPVQPIMRMCNRKRNSVGSTRPH